MRRLTLILLILLGFTTSSLLSGIAYASGEATCCVTKKHCQKTLIKMSCCKVPSGLKAAGTVTNVQKPAPIFSIDPFHGQHQIEMACGKNPPKDSGEDPPEETSLYLLKESFLI